MATYSERTLMIAGIIERYVNDHPRAADTAEGIRGWWIAPQRQGDTLQDVETALDYLVDLRILFRVVLADGSVIYGRAERPNSASVTSRPRIR